MPPMTGAGRDAIEAPNLHATPAVARNRQQQYPARRDAQPVSDIIPFGSPVSVDWDIGGKGRGVRYFGRNRRSEC